MIDWFFFSQSQNRLEETEEQKPEDAFREVITSCRSLSTYEPSSIKSALPQVIDEKRTFSSVDFDCEIKFQFNFIFFI